MGFWKRIDNKIKAYLENQIEKIDKADAEREKNNLDKNEASNKQIHQSNDSVNDVGMYFMELHESYKKDRSYKYDYEDYILNFYWLLACSCQGRKNEVDEILKEAKSNDIFYSRIQDFEPQIMRMTKVSKKVDELNMSDAKEWESVGEYQHRKLSKSKTFMKDFNFFKGLDIEKMFN